MLERGLRPAHAPWFGLKLGVVLLLLLPLEAMHAWVHRRFIVRALRATATPATARELERGISMDAMLRALALPLLGLALPLLVWLSVAKPF